MSYRWRVTVPRLERKTEPGTLALQRKPGFVTIIVRPPGRAPYAVPLERLTEHLRAARKLMGISRDELRAKRLKATGVVGASRQATADMYDRIIEAGGKVAEARAAAEEAHMGDLREQVRDLVEDLEELGEFAQAANPTKGAGATAAPAKPTTKPATGSEALAALNAAQPRLDPKAWGDGDAYHGTHPPEAPPQGS